MTDVRTRLAEARKAIGLSQLELAARTGLSRQTLNQIENGKTSPSVDVALAIAGALGATVEALFGREASRVVTAEGAVTPEQRAIVGHVGGRWVAHATLGADGVRTAETVARRRRRGAEVELFASEAEARRRVLVMGCAPALGVLAARLNERGGAGWFEWLPRSSEVALDELAADRVHVGGTHLVDARTSAPDLAEVRRRAGRRGLAVVALAHWEMGLVVARGNPLRARDAKVLGRRGVRVALREPGSGARRWLEAEVARAGLAPEVLASRGVLTAHTHLGVAEAVALGAADVGPATQDAARSHGCDFVPLARERFDLVLAQEALEDPRLARMMEMLVSGAFRRELAGLGYEPAESGRVVETVRAA